MKSIAYTLVLMIALHSVCGADCLDATLAALHTDSSPAKPACHDDAAGNPATPSHDHSSQDSGNKGCGQAQALESGGSQISKWSVSSPPVADLAEPILFDQSAVRAMHVIAVETPPEFIHPSRAVALRI